MPFSFIKSEIPEIILIQPKVFDDSRGFFLETYKYSDFFNNGITENFVQDNHSKSSKGVLRGLHYQLAPSSQGKLVRCTSGKIYDVAVDIRKNSATFSKWVAFELNEENKNMVYIPSGFAHGFVVLSETAEIIYKTTEEYKPNTDRGIRWNDPSLKVDWKIDFEPLLSEKDKSLPFFGEAELL